MTGKQLAITERDKRLLSEVQRFGVLTRDHLIRLRLFSSKTRANERLHRLVGAGYLTARKQAVLGGGPRLVYFPGRLLSGSGERCGQREVSEMFLAHQLGVVDIRIAFERAASITRWLSDKELAAIALGIVPDGYVEYEVRRLTYSAFLEYDRGTESLIHIERKVRAYLDLAYSGKFEQAFQHRFFRVLLVSETAGRSLTMSRSIARLTDRVIRLTTVSELSSKGPLGSIWRRPGASECESLTDS